MMRRWCVRAGRLSVGIDPAGGYVTLAERAGETRVWRLGRLSVWWDVRRRPLGTD